jgi:hypothetical protein
MANPEPYVKDQIRYELKISGILYPDDLLDEEVESRYSDLDLQEFRRLQEEIIDYKLKLLMEEVVEANYQRIKDEVADLVARAWAGDEAGSDDAEDGSSEEEKNEEEKPGTEPVFVEPFHEI